MKSLSAFVFTIVALTSAHPARASFVTFETGQVRPLALSPDGTRLFAVNTPDNRLEIFDVDVNGDLTHSTSVPVGMEPAAVAVRPDGTQVWVVNHLSDSVSIVDLTGAEPRVIRTLLVGDEPRDIVFAGGVSLDNDRAFITTAHRGQNTPFHDDPPTTDIIQELTTEGIGRADVWVFDAANLGATLEGTPLTLISFFTDTPRALAASANGTIVYAAGFHTGNQTTAVSEGVVCNDTNLSNNTPQGSCSILSTTYPGGLPNPERSSDNVARPESGLVVKFSAGQWRDQLNRNWNNAVKFDLPDRDVFTIDADAPVPVPVVGPTGIFGGVGTVLFNMVVNPDPLNGNVYVSNTEARNEVRFEGSGIIGGSTVRGHLHEARITVLQGSTVLPRHLNKHINYAVVPSPPGTADDSLATPTEMVVSSDGDTLYVAAFSSGKVGVYDTTQLELNTFVPATVPHISVSGGGPSGLVLNGPKSRLYVFTRFDNAVSVIDTGSNLEIDHLPVYNPEPPEVVNGRPFLYDALATSSNGEASCAACHIFGDFDSLGWDLGNPDDEVLDQQNPFRLPNLGSFADHHPMKGPMTTQSLRGMADHGPMHWRGDRSGANDPGGSAFDEDAAFKRFNPAFVGLLGRSAELSAANMQAFTDFILQVAYPPNPVRELDNVLTPDQAVGENFYFGPNSDGVFNCNGCHTLNRSYGFFGSDGCSSFENETQLFKVAHLRNVYQKVGMFGMPAIQFVGTGDNGPKGEQIRGFGFLHDGSIDTVFRFLHATVFSFPGGDAQRRQVEAFVLAFDSNLAPIVGQQVTLSSTNGVTVDGRIDLLIAQASSNYIVPQPGPPNCGGQSPLDHPQLPATKHCDLIVKGVVDSDTRGWLYQSNTNSFRSDRVAEPLLTDANLRALAGTAEQELTYTCVPPGSGMRAGIDRDEDSYFDSDEVDAGSDPADPGSIPSGPTNTPTNTGIVTPTPTPTSTSPISAQCGNIPHVRVQGPGKGTVLFRAIPGKEGLQWKWLKGAQTDPAELGDPVQGSTGYSLCVYSGPGGGLALSVGPVLQAACGNGPCWKATGSGYRYKDTAASNDGVHLMSLKAGPTGNAKMIVKGRGLSLQLPNMAPSGLPLPVQVVLQNGLGECWATTFTTATKNDGTIFKAKQP